MEVTRAIIDLFQIKRQIPGLTENEKLNFKYLDNGFFDSVEIVEMITRIENMFSIELSNDDLQSTDFKTVGGLVKIIKNLTQQN